MTTVLAITTGTAGVAIGMVLLMPGLMAFDAGDKTSASMILLGVSSLSIVPIAVVATTLTIVTQNPMFQGLYLLPVAGIGSAFAIETFLPKVNAR